MSTRRLLSTQMMPLPGRLDPHQVTPGGDVERAAIGAAAENMALQATSMGIGSLWIGNIFFAYDELHDWLGEGEMVMAMSFGYPNHNPCPLARKSEDDVIEVRL